MIYKPKIEAFTSKGLFLTIIILGRQSKRFENPLLNVIINKLINWLLLSDFKFPFFSHEQFMNQRLM
jgi:hypothetical protein